MFVIRRTFLIIPGRRDEAVAVVKEMMGAMHKELGMPSSRIMTGSIGPSDSQVESETTVASLADFEATMQKANSWPGMQRFSEKLGPLIVPGSGRFEVYRLQS